MKDWLVKNGERIGLLLLIAVLLYWIGFVKGELRTRDDMIDRYSGWVENGRIRGK